MSSDMESSRITLDKNERLYTHIPGDALWLEQGSVRVFVVPWDTAMQESVGQPVRLADISAAQHLPIPSFAAQNADGRAWRFCVTADEDQTVLQVRPKTVTQVLQRKFLTAVGIQTWEQEGGPSGGYENSLISFYNTQRARGSSVIHQSEKNAPEVRQTTFRTIHSGVGGGEENVAGGRDLVYRTVCFAAKKCRITGVAAESKVRETIGDAPMSVAEIARASHFICREVVLDEKWFESDCGVLVASIREETVDARGKKRVQTHPGVLFRKGGRYQLYDGRSGETTPLTEQVMNTLEPKAWLIRRALPRRALTRRDLTGFVRRSIEPREIGWLIVLAALGALIGVLMPKLNQLIYDEYIPMGDFSLLAQVCLVIAAFMVGNVFISVVKSLLETIIPSRAGYELQDATYQRLFEMHGSFFRKYDSADLAQRLMSVGSIANTIVGRLVVSGFTAAVSLVYLVQMISYSGQLTLAGVGMILVFALAMYLISMSTLKHSRTMAEHQGEASGKLYQYISAIEKIRMAGAEERAILEYTLPVVEQTRTGLRVGRRSAATAVLADAASTVFSMVMYVIIVKGKLEISTGAFMAFMSAFGALTSSIMSVVQSLVSFNELKPSMERVKPVFFSAPEDDAEKDVVTELRGEISVEDVSFGYDKEAAPVLSHISLHIRPGEYVALVGQSGCGKSTLLKLLLGFEEADSGRIAYDGRDVKSLDKHSLRKHLGVVLQNGRLIAGSIFENITITSHAPSVKKVWQVIDDVGLTEDVRSMPMQIHTPMSESGGTISGGQQQRILIARAIYNDPSVLFFDEATSALDNLTQARVCQSLEKRSMTRVVIAHRLSTVRGCDRILVLDKGRVAEEGTFEQLMAMKGQFYEMASRQIL